MAARAGHGNPLALLELPRGLSAEQLQGRAALPGTDPLDVRITGGLVERVERLPTETQASLLIAALDDRDEVATVMRASDEAGLSADALDAAERDGLLRIADGAVEFRHPLVRSALLESSTHSQRRAGHAALAAALVPTTTPIAASGTRRSRASAPTKRSLPRSKPRRVDTNRARGTPRPPAAFARAAELSSDDGSRMRRLAAAARAAWAAGQPDQARDLIAQVLPLAPDGLRAELLYLRGVIEARTGDLRGATAVLVEAAETSESPSFSSTPERGGEAASYAGESSQSVAVGARAGAIEPQDQIDRFVCPR